MLTHFSHSFPIYPAQKREIMFSKRIRTLVTKTIKYDKYGGPEVLYSGTRQMNKLDDNSVRIKVQYSALNRADLCKRIFNL